LDGCTSAKIETQNPKEKSDGRGAGTDPSKVNIEIQLPDMPPPLDLK
jgi:hypothetical protein